MEDFGFTDHGSVTILTARTRRARAWITEHIPAEATRFGGGIVIEPRYAADVLAGLTSDGLTVNEL